MMKFILKKPLLKVYSWYEKFASVPSKTLFISALRQNSQSLVSDDIKIGKNITHLISPSSQITWGTDVEVRNHCHFVAEAEAKLHIASHVFINNYCSINCLEKVFIGEHTLLGEGVKIYDHNHQYSRTGVVPKQFNTAPVKIGKHCWLGSNVVVLKGVHIGDYSIIGAGCIVHKDLPAYSLVHQQQNIIIHKL